jgi:hypothetical protein
VQERHKPAFEPPKIAAPKEAPIVTFVRSMRAAGEVRAVGPNEIRAFRLLREADLPIGANLRGIIDPFVQRFVEKGTPASASAETYGSVDEFLAHEGYAVR